MKKSVYILFLAVSLLGGGLLRCNEGDSGRETRSFYMGFTPWPYALTTAALSDVYSFINQEGDLVAHHFQQGIPYTASNTLDFTTYHSSIQSEIDGRITATTSGKIIYLAIDSLNPGRDDLADLWESSPNMARPAPWDSRSFNDPEVITAYTNFSLAVINRFVTYYGRQPIYFNYAPEISELMLNNASEYLNFITFASTVYSSLKGAYPNLKLMVSIALKSPGSAEMATVTTGFDSIKNYVDVVGISSYGYAFYTHAGRGDPGNLPSDWLSQITAIAPGKPYAVTETGWIAENLVIPAYAYSESSNPSYQDLYLKKLFFEADALQMQTVIWFTSYDYDVLWNDTLGQDNLSKIWKDTGLINELFAERPALSRWRNWHARVKK